ncbi:MAG TPA: chloride channel protein, partial [Gemmataceae bacterium]|nr:chloride channel protein [Gemmataceae bacterium]
IAGYYPAGPAGEPIVPWLEGAKNTLFRPWLLLLVPVLGGLVSGYLVFRFAPEAEGHGTDSVIAAYHHKQGEIRARVPLIKLLASAITLGTGGSGGREGPIAQIGAGFGSLLGKLLRLGPTERRILVAAGMGAGIAAIFRAPLAGALFAAEVLYRSTEFEREVIIPAGVSSVVAYSTFGLFFGWEPLFRTPPELMFQNAWQLLPYAVLALAMALLAMIYTRTFYWFTYLAHQVPLPRILKPAVGAFFTGVIGVALYFGLGQDAHVLSVFSFGYGILQDSMSHETQLSAVALLAVALGKILTTSLTIGSGGSGGVFGPSMVIGGCGGGALGLLLHRCWPELVPHPASCMIVGMAGFFAAAAKTPFSTLVIVSELTGDYRLIVPALWVNALAYLLSDEQSLYRSQVESRSLSPAHQGFYIREVLAGQTVAQLLRGLPEPGLLRPDDNIDTVMDRFDQSSRTVLPVVERTGRLLGVIHLHEIYWTAIRRETLPWILASDLMRGNIKPLQPDHSIERAVELFAENDLPELPVVSADGGQLFLGMIRRTDIARAYLRRVHGKMTATVSELPGPASQG